MEIRWENGGTQAEVASPTGDVSGLFTCKLCVYKAEISSVGDATPTYASSLQRPGRPRRLHNPAGTRKP